MAKSVSIFWIFSILWKGPATKGGFSTVSQCTGFVRKSTEDMEAFSEGEFPVPKERVARESGGMNLLARWRKKKREMNI